MYSVIPRGANNVNTMPVDVIFWGRPDTKAEVLNTLRQHGHIVYEGLSQVPAHGASASFSNNNASLSVPTNRTFLNPVEVFQVGVCKYIMIVVLNCWTLLSLKRRDRYDQSAESAKDEVAAND